MKVYFCPSRREPTVQSGTGHVGALGDYACASNTAVPPGWFFDNPTAVGAMIVGNASLDQTGEWVTTWRAQITFTRVRDGLSNTIFVGEKHVPEPWFGQGLCGDGLVYDGVNPPFSYARVAGAGYPLARADDVSATAPYRFGSFHPGICQFVFGDGSVRAIDNGISEETLFRLVHRADGQVIRDF